MKLKELREYIKDLPDETEVYIEYPESEFLLDENDIERFCGEEYMPVLSLGHCNSNKRKSLYISHNY